MPGPVMTIRMMETQIGKTMMATTWFAVTQRIEQIRVSCDTWWRWLGIRRICCYQQEDRYCKIICISEWALKFFLSENIAMNAQQFESNFEKQSGYELWQRQNGTLQWLHESEYSWVNLLCNRNGIPDWTEIRVACKVSVMHDWNSYARRLSIIEKQSGTTILSNQHGFIFIISQVCATDLISFHRLCGRISSCCGVDRQPDS